VTVFQPLDRVSVGHHVMAEIQAAMQRGELRRGDRLPTEMELADQFQVSRTSIREALKVLEVIGLLEVRRGSGTYVATTPRMPTVDPLLFLLLLEDGTRGDLVDLRFIVEVGFTQLAQRRMEPAVLDMLEQNVSELEAAVAAGSVTADHDLSFHRIILEATKNPFVIQIGRTVLELFRDSIGRGVQTFPERAVDHHRAIVAALRHGTNRDVEAAIRDSYELWKDLG
jgi:GntR family transcriptional regulator, transcriptional repressor for pyruvate dehydrogenase complex